MSPGRWAPGPMSRPECSAGRHDRMFPLDFQRRVARDRLAIEVEEIDGGHMVAMSNPAVLAVRLEDYRLEVQGRDRL